MTTSTLLVIIPGFGNPHVQAKVDILRKNMSTIRNTNVFTQPHFRIFQYEAEAEFTMPTDIANDPDVTITKEPGIIMQFLHKHVVPSVVEHYDYVMILLDDVELLEPVPWTDMLTTKQCMKYDIVACCLKERSMSYWEFTCKMKDPNVWIREQAVCECFCYLMDRNTYNTYYTFIDPNNPWSWGMDFIIHSHMKLRCAVFNDFVGHHYFNNLTSGQSVEARKASSIYFQKYGTSWDDMHKKPRILRVLHRR